MGVGGQSKAQTALTPRKRPRAHCVGGWAPGSIWIGAENLGLDPRTSQAVASRYAGYTIPVHLPTEAQKYPKPALIYKYNGL